MGRTVKSLLRSNLVVFCNARPGSFVRTTIENGISFFTDEGVDRELVSARYRAVKSIRGASEWMKEITSR